MINPCRLEDKKPKDKLALFSKTMLLLNILAIGSLLLSYTAPYISPELFWPVAFFGLAYPYILLVNFIFIIYWTMKSRKYFLLSFIAILLGWNNLTRIVQFNGDSAENAQHEGLKITSFNVRLFDLYNWQNNLKTRDGILNFLSDNQPDIVCFQEFFYSEQDFFPTLDTIPIALGTPHYYVEDSRYVKAARQHFGTATFSKYPIVNKGKIKFDLPGNCSIFTDMLINGDTIRVYNIHLASVHFIKKDYENLDDPTLEASKISISKIKQAFILRAQQADRIADHIKACPYPILLCGDFNDTPISYAYKKISKNLSDAFVISGSGIGATHKGFIKNAIAKHLSFRIDYIMHSPELNSASFVREKADLSDHYPIHCKIRIPE